MLSDHLFTEHIWATASVIVILSESLKVFFKEVFMADLDHKFFSKISSQ